MKATMGMNYRLLSTNLESMSNRLFELRQQAATGKKLNRPSDDPSAIRPVLNYRMQSASTERYLKHLGSASGEMKILDSQLGNVENIMVSAKETTTAAMNGAANESDMQTYADRIAQLHDELLYAANSQTNGKYMFSGYAEFTRPFEVNPVYDEDDPEHDDYEGPYEPDDYDRDDAATWPVQYTIDPDEGGQNIKTVEVEPGKHIDRQVSGEVLFLGQTGDDEDGVDLFRVLRNVEHAMRNRDVGKMEQGLEELETGAEQVRRIRGRMGNNAWRIDRAELYLSDASIEFKSMISSYEDADLLAVFSDLVQQETAFEAALNVTTRVSRLSILDFM